MRVTALVYCSIVLLVSINIVAFVRVSEKFRKLSFMASKYDTTTISTAEALRSLQIYDKEC